MTILKLALRNLIGAGLRTWLNVTVLSISYVIIVWHQGMFIGMLNQVSHEMIKDEVAGGHYWHQLYDPLDPISIDDSHAMIPSQLSSLIAEKKAVPILIRQASIYPNGRMQTVLLKGIDPKQKILGMPTWLFAVDDPFELPILVGKQMAKTAGVSKGDYLTVRWRDANGTFDAREGKIVGIMDTIVPTIDRRQLWIPLFALQSMTEMADQATIVVLDKSVEKHPKIEEWEWKDQDFLLSDIYAIVHSKRVYGSILYVLLLFLAMLAIFDTQVLAIFKRRKEIGTLIALGMTRMRVIMLFTIEGMIHGILAVFVGALYGVPLLIMSVRHGIKMPGYSQDTGIALSSRLFPEYPIGLVVGTVIIVMITVTIVSFMPSRKIAKLKPTDAIKGKIS